MIWWWIGNALLALVVIPTVGLLALRVVRPLLEIRAYADDILQHGLGAADELGAVQELLRTRELTAAARRAGRRHSGAVESER